MIDHNLSVLGALLGPALIILGIGLLYSYAQSHTPVEDAAAPPDFLIQIFSKFKLAAKICIALGIILLAITILTGTGQQAAEININIPVSLYYIAALGLLLVILSYNVLHHRVKGLLQSFGKENPTTERIARVHANFTEYVPTGLVLLITLEWSGAPALILHTAGGIFTLGRYLHAWGYTKTDGPHLGRMFGIQLTLLALIFMVVAAVYYLLFV